MVKTTTVMAALLALSMFGCDDSDTKLDQRWDCKQICDEAKRCVGNDNFDLDGCKKECRDDDNDAVDRCENCLDGNDSCTEEATSCTDECSGVFLMSIF